MKNPLDRFPTPSCARFLGYEFISLDREAQTMKVRFQPTEEMLNPRGTVQGGFLTAMLDDAMGSMVVVLSNGEKGPASVDIHTQYMRPAGLEPLVCEAEVVQMTKTTVFTRGTLFNPDGKKVAAATQTARLLNIRGT